MPEQQPYFLQGHHLHDIGLMSMKTHVADCKGRYLFLASTTQQGKGSLLFQTMVFSERGVGAAIPGFRADYASLEAATSGHCATCNAISMWDPDQGPLTLVMLGANQVPVRVDYHPPYKEPAAQWSLVELLDSLKNSPFRRPRPPWPRPPFDGPKGECP